MLSYEYDDATQQYQELVLAEIEAEAFRSNPITSWFKFSSFLSNSKGRTRRRSRPKHIEIVSYRARHESHLLKNLPLDTLATEIYGRDGEAKFNGYYHSIAEKLEADIRGLRK